MSDVSPTESKRSQLLAVHAMHGVTHLGKSPVAVPVIAVAAEQVDDLFFVSVCACFADRSVSLLGAGG